MRKLFAISLLTAFTTMLSAQDINPNILQKRWKATWIAFPGESGKDYGVYHFRKVVELASKPSSFVVHVSADNRYKLFVNNVLMSLGPARGDIYNWNFETIDIAPHLVAGMNTIAALVWNEGEYRPEAQISHRTGFILQGNTSAEEVLNTNDSWKVVKSAAYRPLSGVGYPTYYVAGAGEIVDMRQSNDDWTSVSYDDTSWSNAKPTGWGSQGAPKGMVDAFGWMLVPSQIPQMEMTDQRFESVRRSQGVSVPKAFPKSSGTITIPPKTTATLLLDQSHLTNAFVTLKLSGGKDAGISLQYAEALFQSANPIIKGNRNEIEGKKILGRKDSIISNGKANQSFTTLAWRTYRYVQLRITTAAEPLTINDIFGTFTGFPFKRAAKFESSDASSEQILDVGWRTARLCAVETYMDCPYYEQLQYIGDARIQALVSYYNAGDDRLVINALNQMDQSRISEGVTLSRHPSYSPQIIPTFSLWYIGMLHDFWRYRPDASFVQQKLHGVREILHFFSKYQQPDGLLKNPPYWVFTDWVNGKKTWDYGMAPRSADGNSCALDFQLLWAYQLAAELESALGMESYSKAYAEKASQLMATIKQKYWDPSAGMFADTPEKKLYSQHANTLAILTGTVAGEEAKTLALKILSTPNLAPASIYFRYYVHQALTKAGLGDDYVSWLDKWKENIQLGLTTWAEISEVTEARSDCHAWGSSPNIEYFRIVLGIDSDAPGFSKVRIEPHLGKLTFAHGEIPHPNGSVRASYRLEKTTWKISLTLPAGVTGTFRWQGKEMPLREGNNEFNFKSQI